LRFTPFLILDLWHILAIFVDVLFVLDESVLHHLLRVGALGTPPPVALGRQLSQFRHAWAILIEQFLCAAA
jgi:hypothetical protein